MVKINGTMINYYSICQRSVWYLIHGLEAAQDHPFLEIGRFITQESYTRSKKEVVFENLKIDLVKKENNDVVVAEIKKSSKAKKSAQLQLAYYLYRLKEIGLIAQGELLFPKEKKREKVLLTKELESTLQAVLLDIEEISKREKPPDLKKITYCRNCAYRDFCWC
ncbi:MAG TPA: CRISPR-associated protein Cas4 [bacterium]|nr:CRISPR-associated protein Cas4 [Atribacterota bacterium]HQG58739.1 CRISPR-associated protein Cas4 [bacterium]